MLIDVTLAGDNAVVVALSVAGLPASRRRLAILLGTDVMDDQRPLPIPQICPMTLDQMLGEE